jgi:hypothetical protein
VTLPLKVTYDDATKTYTIDHQKRRHMNVVKVIYLKAPGLSYKDVRTTRHVGRDCFFDREKDIIYLGDDEFNTSQAYMKMEQADINRYFIGLLKSCGLKSWLDAVS